MRKPLRVWLVALVVGGVSMPSLARAHFTLDYPPSWTVDSTVGDPQKAYPCGVLPTDMFTSSNVVTTFAPGQKITVKWTERVVHPGWFRIALSYRQGAELASTTDFSDPLYQTNAQGTLSVDAGIEATPVPPVLADGLWKHPGTNTAPTQYASDITLPTMPCKKCVLQVLQIMLNHPINQPNNNPDGGNGAGFTYHHCAYIAIDPGEGGTLAGPDGGDTSDATVTSSGSSGTGSGSGAATNGSSGTGGSSGGPGGSGSGGAGSGSGAATGGSSSTGGSSGGAGGPGSSSSSGGGVESPSDDASSSGLKAGGGNGGGSGGGGCSLARGPAEGGFAFASLSLIAVAMGLRRRRR